MSLADGNLVNGQHCLRSFSYRQNVQRQAELHWDQQREAVEADKKALKGTRWLLLKNPEQKFDFSRYSISMSGMRRLKHVFSLFILLNIAGYPPISHAQGNAIFPEEQVNDLLLVVADPDNFSFVVRNRANEQRKGIIGDFLGAGKAEVIKITYRDVTVKAVEIIADKDGNTYEQPTATTLLSGITNCFSNALPWLEGAWELKYDPDNSKTDWMFFNNTTCQFGLMLHDGRVTVAQEYDVNEVDDGTFNISIRTGSAQSRPIVLTVSSDRSRIYNETGAYYAKVSDNYRDMNDRGFRKRQLRASGE